MVSVIDVVRLPKKKPSDHVKNYQTAHYVMERVLKKPWELTAVVNQEGFAQRVVEQVKNHTKTLLSYPYRNMNAGVPVSLGFGILGIGYTSNSTGVKPNRKTI